MSIFLIIYNTLLKLGLLSFVFFIAYNYVVRHKLNKLNFLLLYILHYGITFLAWFFTLNSKTDATYYFKKAQEATSWFDIFGLSSKMISFMLYPLIHYFKFDFQLSFLFFSSFSFFGFLIFYKLINNLETSKDNTLFGIKTLNIILFLPTFHFWVCSIGKDSIVFFLFILLIDRVNKCKKYNYQLAVILLLILFIRPYIIIFLLSSYSICLLFMSLTSMKKFFFFITIFFAFSVITWQVFKTMNMDVFSFLSDRLDYVVRYFDRREGTGSFIDPSQYSSISKAFMYLFSPTILSASSLSSLYVGLENLILLIIFGKLVYNFSISYIRKNLLIAVLLVYVIMFLFVKSYLMYNLGLANRQKYMILPSIFYIMFMLYNNRNKAITQNV